MPNLPNRYAYSNTKAAHTEPVVVRGESVREAAHPCMDCGVPVTTARCTACATRAVGGWVRTQGARGAEIYARYYARHEMDAVA